MNPRELEKIIEKIDGIKAVKVVGEGDSVKEIHVITNGGKNPKQIVRDIETAVFALTGFKLDRKVVSVAQLNGDEASKRRSRIELVNLEIDESGFEVSVRVEVSKDGEASEGEATGPRTSSRTPIVIGEAVINALSNGNMAISLDDVQTVNLNNKSYVLSHLTCFDGSREWEVVGVAPMGEDINKSISLSVIDALEKIL